MDSERAPWHVPFLFHVASPCPTPTKGSRRPIQTTWPQRSPSRSGSRVESAGMTPTRSWPNRCKAARGGYLERARYVVMKRPPVSGHGGGRG